MSWARKKSSASPPAAPGAGDDPLFAGVDAQTRRQFKFSSGTSKEEIKLQVTKFKENIAVLYGAGYHRAKISALSLFDRVIGGLCWSISNAGISVDVDILFQEDVVTTSSSDFAWHLAVRLGN